MELLVEDTVMEAKCLPAHLVLAPDGRDLIGKWIWRATITHPDGRRHTFESPVQDNKELTKEFKDFISSKIKGK